MSNKMQEVMRTRDRSLYKLREGEKENYRCFHCLTWYTEIPGECINCGCDIFTSRNDIKLEDELFETSTHFTAGLGELNKDKIMKIATNQTKKIRERTTITRGEVSELDDATK